MSGKGYYYFADGGIYGMPELENLREFRSEGRKPFFILDSCMCLELVKLADYGRKANIDKRELLHFLDLLKRSKGKMFTLGGLIELSSDRETQVVDREKFFDLFHRIKMIDLIPMRVIRAFNFNFDKNYYVERSPEIPLSIKGFDDMLKPTYCCLLKIREIALANGTSKERYRKNLGLLLDWMHNELDIMMGIEFKLAMNIFGGETVFRRMVNLDGKEINTAKSLYGTAWDICHYRIFAKPDSLSKIVSEDAYPVFVTKDQPFYELVKSIISEKYNEGSSLIVDFNKPRFLDDELTDAFYERMLNLAAERYDRVIAYDEEKVSRLIKALESANKF